MEKEIGSLVDISANHAESSILKKARYFDEIDQIMHGRSFNVTKFIESYVEMRAKLKVLGSSETEYNSYGMKEVVLYECMHCGKVFKTPNRHVCKYNPEFKNCYTCANNRGFEEVRENLHTDIIVNCSLDHSTSALDISTVKMNLACEDYLHGCKWFENIKTDF